MHKILHNRIAAALLPALLATACGDEPAARPHEMPEKTSCVPDGSLQAEIYGGLRASLSWDAAVLECEGMPRPDGEGARLRFAGPADAEDGPRRLAVILGLPDLERGRTGSELPTNVTMIEEDEGRFFSNRELTNCWTDIREQARAAGSEQFRISGILYCVSPLSELNGSSSVTIPELEFVGELDWRVPD